MNQDGQRVGFTIVELLIVIVVIAILATITIIAFTGVQRRAYYNRAISESGAVAKAVGLYYADKGTYPADVERNIPVAIFDYTGNEEAPEEWPNAPWPGSVYDYDNFIGSDGNETVQVSIRFCPVGGPLSACQFPNEPWAADFDVQSSAYWCITGVCRAHPSSSDSHPAYCLNCDD